MNMKINTNYHLHHTQMMVMNQNSNHTETITIMNQNTHHIMEKTLETNQIKIVVTLSTK